MVPGFFTKRDFNVEGGKHDISLISIAILWIHFSGACTSCSGTTEQPSPNSCETAGSSDFARRTCRQQRDFPLPCPYCPGSAIGARRRTARGHAKRRTGCMECDHCPAPSRLLRLFVYCRRRASYRPVEPFAEAESARNRKYGARSRSR